MKTKLTLLALATSMALAACGGGGSTSAPSTSTGTSPTTGTGTSPTTGTGTTTPTPDPTALQVNVAAPTYTAGSLEASAFTALNQVRTTYGVGQVAQNTQLDTAAQNHATYLNNRFVAGDYNAPGHTEDAANAGFTGVNPADRIAFAKYAASSTNEDVSEIIAVDNVASDPGVVAIQTLLAGPYHRFSLLDGSRDVGLGHTGLRTPNAGGVQNTFVADFGVQQAGQLQAPAAGWIGVWPADNATGVNYGFAGESPNPLPANNGACGGYPVSLQVKTGVTLAVTAFTLTDAAGAAVNVQLATPTVDANPTFARSNSAYIIPFAPLKLATKYTAHFVGSQNGVAIDKTWSFTTRADNSKMVYGCDPS